MDWNGLGKPHNKRGVKDKMVKINIKEDRKEIERIIRINLPLMNKNELMCQEIADCIIAYLIGALKDDKPDCGGMYMVKKAWLKIKQQTKSEMDSLIADLKMTMNKTATSTDDEDW